jgi:hypothetical protein
VRMNDAREDARNDTRKDEEGCVKLGPAAR